MPTYTKVEDRKVGRLDSKGNLIILQQGTAAAAEVVGRYKHYDYRNLYTGTGTRCCSCPVKSSWMTYTTFPREMLLGAAR